MKTERATRGETRMHGPMATLLFVAIVTAALLIGAIGTVDQTAFVYGGL